MQQFMQFCSLIKDYELLPEMSIAMIQGAMIRLMLQRLSEQQLAA
jgi:hypothetical protein